MGQAARVRIVLKAVFFRSWPVATDGKGGFGRQPCSRQPLLCDLVARLTRQTTSLLAARPFLWRLRGESRVWDSRVPKYGDTMCPLYRSTVIRAGAECN